MGNLWDDVRACFESDDGSLPGIEIAKLSPKGVSAIYAMLRTRSALFGNVPEFWSRLRNESVLVDSVTDAAGLVATGEAEPFHHCIHGLTSRGIELPVLGVFVWPDSVELDYRMGSQWGPAQVIGFFELLRECSLLDVSAVVAPAELEGPPYPERFSRAWAAFCINASPDTSRDSG